MRAPAALMIAVLVMAIVSLLGVESATTVCGPESRRLKLKGPAKLNDILSVLDMHAYRAVLALLEKTDSITHGYEAVRHLPEYEQLQGLLNVYSSLRRLSPYPANFVETLNDCVQSIPYSSIYAAKRDEIRPQFERCACKWLRRQLSRAIVLFFDCELESVVISDAFASVYREKVTRLNFLVRKRMVLSGDCGDANTVLELYDALFDKCVQQPLMRVASPLEIEIPEALKSRSKPKPTSEPTVSSLTTLAQTDPTEHGGNEASMASGCTDAASKVSSARINGDSASSPEDAGTTTSRESEPALVSEEGSESIETHTESHTNMTGHAAVEISSTAGDATVANIPANTTESHPRTSKEQPELTESPHVVRDNPTRGLEISASASPKDTGSLDGDSTATSQADDPIGHENDEPRSPSAAGEPSSPALGAPEPNESEQILSKTPTASAVDTASQSAKTSVDSLPEKGSESSLFWVLLSCVAVLVLGLLLVLMGDRLKHNVYQWVPLVDLDSQEPPDSQQVTPEMVSSHDAPSTMAELVDETLVSPTFASTKLR